MNLKAIAVAAAVCVPCVDWTRFTGYVKKVDLHLSTVTIQLKGGDKDIIIVPVDYQVKIESKGKQVQGLKDLSLDEPITLLRVPSDPAPSAVEDMSGMAPPEPMQRGR